MASIYAIVGWVLVQVAGALEDAIGLPAWFDGMVVALLLIGLPIALLLTWAFEMTPEGVRRTAALTAGEAVGSSNHKMDVLIIMGLIAVLGLGAYQQFNPAEVIYIDSTSEQAGSVNPISQATEKTEVDDASIAVLPFADLSPNKDQDYFSDGIAEELLNVLVRVEGLKVASRTSSFAFKGQSTLGIPIIAEQLKVRHVLEGSVRKSGQMIRITAQLIDANSDQHLWSETYDRRLTTENIFAIQDEISAAIVEALRDTLGADLGEIDTVGISTENLDAYELYLKAHQGFLARNRANIPSTINLYQQAVTIDPDFARAWAGLAVVYAIAPSWGVTDQDYYQLGTAAANKAIELDSKLALPFAALGNMLSAQIPADFVAASEHFNQALKLDPQNTTSLLFRGAVNLQTGFFKAARADFEQCLLIDPQYENCRRFLALALLFNGDNEQALSLFEQGVLAGSTAHSNVFVHAYAVAGDDVKTLLAMRWMELAFNYHAEDIKFMYYALTNPVFDFNAGQLEYARAYQLRTGGTIDWNTPDVNFMALYLRKYEVFKPSAETLYWWDPNLPDFLVSPHRKRLMRAMGIYDYWLATEFPPQCRAIGEDDFECD